MMSSVDWSVSLPLPLPLLLATGLLGCGGQSPVQFAGPTPNPGCSDPYAGFERFTEDAAGHGVSDLGIGATGNSVDIGVVVSDMDDDGDLDLMLGKRRSFPRLFRNDGGHFTQVAETGNHPVDEVMFSGPSLVDLNGDNLPEIVRGGLGVIAVHDNWGA